METQFMSVIDLARLQHEAEQGNQKAVFAFIVELDRLRGIIQDYEIVIHVAIDKFNSKTHKQPSPLNLNQSDEKP